MMSDRKAEGGSALKRALYVLGQLVWGFPQTLIGFVVFLLNLKRPHRIFYGAVCTSWKLKSSLSMGLFIFVTDDPFCYYGSLRPHCTCEECRTMLAVHEYGHTIQSLYWGPLYLLAVALPSLAWAGLPVFRRHRAGHARSYFDAYPEAQANRLGERATGLRSPGKI